MSTDWKAAPHYLCAPEDDIPNGMGAKANAETPERHKGVRKAIAPRASVIILTYNQEDKIARAIESVVAQECKYPFEIVIADDCSSDSTRSICEEYARKYPELIRLLPREKNKGLVDNYYDAFEATRGEYVADCAGDDEWLDPRRLQLQIEALDSDRSLSAVYTDVEIADGATRRLESANPEWQPWKRERVSGREVLLGALNNLRTLPFILSAALYRKSAVMPLYEAHRDVVRCPEIGVEDLPLICALGAAGDVGYLDIVGYRYYIDGPSISRHLNYEKEYRFYARLLSGVARLSDFYGIPRVSLRQHFNNKISHIAAQARHSRNPELLSDFERRRREWPLPLPLRARAHILLARISRRRNRLKGISKK